MAYYSTIMRDQPIAYYRLGEVSGTTAKDSSTGPNGTINGGVTLGQPGAIRGEPNTAMAFDGSTGYVDTGVLISNYTAISVECWVKATSTTFANYARIVASDYVGNGTAVEFLTNPHGVGTFFQIGNGTSQNGIGDSTTLTTSAYIHFVGTWDGASLYLYRNGIRNGPAAYSGTLGTTSVSIALGRNNGYSGDYWPGIIDEATIYNIALTPDQITAKYQAGIDSSIVRPSHRSIGRIV